MTTVELCPFQEYDNLFGMIVPCPSGVKWTNQVGGVACLHPEVEGIFFPLPTQWKPDNDPLYNHSYGFSKDLIQDFLNEKPELKTWFRPPEDEPTEPNMYCAEAWIPVLVNHPVTDSPGFWYEDGMKDFVGQLVILTYPNSD